MAIPLPFLTAAHAPALTGSTGSSDQLRTLAIDTSSEACSVALFDDDRLIDAGHRVIGRGHAEQLLPMIAALNDGGRAEQIMVGCGPGSFTGVRVGIAAARALALGWGAEVRGFNSLALVAAARAGEDALVVMDGGHGEWLVQAFAGDGLPSTAHASMAPEMADENHQGIVIGNRAEDFAARFGGEALAALPEARHALRIVAAEAGLPPRPVYARAPDAAVRR
jgi:tRNA threonylcarbamoyladenosine biosynthesis protein TsaB